MTISGNLAPSQGRTSNLDSPYPVLFGVAFTPVVSGILLALAGLIGAIALIWVFVQPLWQQRQELEQNVATKQSQIANQKSTLKEINKVENDLKAAQQKQTEVLSLFADKDQLKTLLFDISEIARDRNARLTKFEPATPEPEIVVDGSVGPEVIGKLLRQTYKVEMEGTFESTRSTMLTIERLQPLLLVKNLKSQSGSQKAILRKSGGQSGILEFDPEADELKTSFDLTAIMPLNPPPGVGATPEPTPGGTPAPGDKKTSGGASPPPSVQKTPGGAAPVSSAPKTPGGAVRNPSVQPSPAKSTAPIAQ